MAEGNTETSIVPTPPPRAAELGVVASKLTTIARVVVMIAIVLFFYTCYAAQEVLTPILLALLLSLLLSPIVTAIERFHIPRALGSGIVVIAVVALAIGAGAKLATPAKDWIAHAPTTISSMQQRFRHFREPIQQAEKASQTIDKLTQSDANTVVVKDQPSFLVGVVSSTPRILAAIAATILLVYFFLSSGDNFLRRLVEISPGMTEKRVVVSIARDIQQQMSRYLVTVSLINVGLGIATAIVLAVLGVPNAILWGALATVLNFAPYVGPAITGLTLLLVGFATFDDLPHAFAVPGAFFMLAFIEGQLVSPMVIGRRLELNPVVVFVWLLIWGWLWGMVGVLLAGPMLACFRIFCQHMPSLRPIYVLIGEAKQVSVAE